MDSDAQAASYNFSPEHGVGRFPAQHLLFFRNFLRHPSRVGWLLPSSTYVVRSVLKRVNWRGARHFIEYGPGTGTVTNAILRRMRLDAKLIVFEVDPAFCNFLRATILDPRFHLVQQSAADVGAVLAKMGMESADCVVSGIPFKPLPRRAGGEIVQKTKRALRPGGQFLVYQFSGVVRSYLREHFSTIEESLEWRNIVPTRIFTCRR